MKELFTKLVGSTFYQGAQQLISMMKPEDALELIEEPENKYDTNAIAVSTCDFKIGYIPGASSKGSEPTNVFVKELIQNNKIKSVTVQEITGGAGAKHYGMNIKIEYEE